MSGELADSGHRDGAGLVGSRCSACGTTAYPVTDGCPRCGAAMALAPLSNEGILWTWTVQRFPPKSPPYRPRTDEFQPFGVGYVELPEGLRVAAIIEVDDLAELRIGLPLRLASADGVPRFAPLGSEAP